MHKYLIKVSKYGLLIISGSIIGISLLEFGVRMLGAKPETYLRKFSQYHPMLGWVKTPNMEGEFRRGDVNIHEKMNSKGLRDAEYEYEKPAGTVRILVLGDSFTEGYDVNIENVFTEILEQKLNKELSAVTGSRYEVINAGTGGYSTDQEYLFYKLEGYKYNPDVVIMMTYAANDIWYNIESRYGNYHKPLYMIKEDTLLLMNTPLPEPKKQEFIKNLFRDMALYPIVTKIVLTKLPGLAEYLSKWGFISKSTLEVAGPNAKFSSAQKYPSSFSIFEKHQSDRVAAAWKITDALIKNLNTVTESNGSKFILFSIPDRFQIYQQSWENTKKLYGVDESIWDRDLPDSLLSTIAKNYAIPFLNMKEYLSQKTSVWEQLYNGVHWNEKGNEIAAKFIFEELTKKGLLKH